MEKNKEKYMSDREGLNEIQRIYDNLDLDLSSFNLRESDLEEFIINSLKNKRLHDFMISRGLETPKTLPVMARNQFRFDDRKRSDIISLTKEPEGIFINLYELKVVLVDAFAMVQVGVYLSKIIRFLKHKKYGSGVHVRVILIGSGLKQDVSYDLIRLISNIPRVSVMIYEFAFNITGLQFFNITPN